MPPKSQNVIVIGASDKPDRYSYKALKLLLVKGHTVYPVHPRLEEIEGLPVFSRLEDVPEPIDTITMYVGADTSSGLEESIIAKDPRRVIFNPGAENPGLEAELKAVGVETLNACTLVMLNTGQF